MQISRHLLLTCAVAACLTPTLVHAADNEAQIRARQALEEKLNQMPPAAAPSNPAPAMSAPPVMTVAPNRASVQSQAAPSAAINISTPSNDAATQQRLQDALRQAASQPQPAMQTPMQPMQPAVTAPPKAAVTVQSQPAQSTPSYISAPSNDDATNQKLQEALRQKMQQTPVETTAPATATQWNVKPATAPKGNYSAQPAWTPAPSSTYAPMPTTTTTHPNLPEMPTPQPSATPWNQPIPPTASLPALQGPATGLSATQEQKLNELLNQYRADQITPQQYHEQRAKILAQP